jgi:hypothetical protein
MWGKREGETNSYRFKDMLCACETGWKYDDKWTGFVQGGRERGRGREPGEATLHANFANISQKSQRML